MTYTLSQLADEFSLSLDDSADPQFTIHGLCGLTDNLADCLSFISAPKHVSAAADSAIPAFICRPEHAVPGKHNLFCTEPEMTIAQIAGRYALEPMRADTPGAIHPTAQLAGDIELGQGVTIGANVVIGSGVKLGSHCRIFANTVIMDQVTLGEHCVVYPNVTIREGCVLGNRVILQPGVVLGGDGFGYVTQGGQHHKIPQIGNVILEDDVEIGSNTTIDRGRFSATRVGKGTKIDNLVMLGHNVTTGQGCLLVSQCGIAGSTQLGNYVILGGQAGVNGHISLGDQVTVMGQTMVSKGLKEPGVYAGQPVKPAHIWRRAVARFYKGLK